MPGQIWMTMNYLLGLERLGYEVAYVESHGRTPALLMQSPDDDSSALAVDFITGMLRRFGFSGRWAYHALQQGRCYGMSVEELHRVYRSAELIINLHGGTKPLPEHVAGGRLIFLETDPVHLQIQLAEGDRRAIEFLEPHAAFFTLAENYGNQDCGLPVTDQFDFRPTRPPVVLDLWRREGPPSGASFRTVGNWRQNWLVLEFAGDVYHWSKHHEFLKFLDLPRRTGQRFEPALASLDDEDRLLLEERGWEVRDAGAFGHDTGAYRDFIHGALAEFSVAKDQNIRLRSGWFSERSACFLASGLPVVVQDTAFGCAVPTGEGLLAFGTPDEAAEAVERVSADPARHGWAALEIAREYFSHEVVLGRLLSELGLPPRVDGPSGRRATPTPALPRSLVVMPVSRHPTELDAATVETVLQRPVPRPRPARRRSDAGPTASVVVLVRDQLPLTRMCLETVLADSPGAELIVVDNASAAEAASYLDELKAKHRAVRVVRNEANRSFAAAVNQGLAAARGELLVILNNDTIVTPGWLDGLAGHLEDPAVGLAGAVTNHAGNEARIGVPYSTYGELVDFARDRAQAHRGQAFDIPVATMFCAAMRSEVYARIGPLDERYTGGMFEDDDYSQRVRAAGLQVVCAEDVFVHHFGKGSFGSLVPTGEYGELFEANRRRWEQKWGREWHTHSRRHDDGWEALVGDVRRLVADSLPGDAVVLVASRGDEALLELGRRTGWHFPRDDAGTYAGCYPADSQEAIAQLQGLQALGATHVVFPSTELWWLDHYRELREYLEAEGEIARTEAGVAYALRP